MKIENGIELSHSLFNKDNYSLEGKNLTNYWIKSKVMKKIDLKIIPM